MLIAGVVAVAYGKDVFSGQPIGGFYIEWIIFEFALVAYLGYRALKRSSVILAGIAIFYTLLCTWAKRPF